jgi:hypothetical protein
MARKIFVLILLLFPFMICFGQDTDVELWLSAQIRTDFKKKFRLYYEQGYRRDEFLAKTKTFTFETGGYYKPFKYLWIGPYFRHYDDLKDSRKNHLVGVILFRKALERFDFKSKTRYIIEFGGGAESKHYLRERIWAGYDIRNFKWNPFVSPEFIFHLKPGQTKNEEIRLDIGMERELAKHHNIDFYYRYSIERNVNNPLNSHVIGIDYVFDF